MHNRRSQLSIEQRLQILQQLDVGIHPKVLAKKYNVLPRTISRIKTTAKDIFEFAERGDNLKKRQSLRKPKNEELDTRLYSWFQQQVMLQNPVSDLLLLEEATKLSKEIPSSSNFKASKGWLQKFKERHQIRLRTIFGEAGNVNINIMPNENANAETAWNESCTKFVQDFAQQIEKESLQYDNIYSMNETGLVWKAIPTSTSVEDNEKKTLSIEMKNNRVTLGLCSNMLGTHKLKPLFINKYENPRTLDCKNCLPVFYKRQSNAWMNQLIFRDWYENNFKTSVKAYQSEKGIEGKVILLVSDCDAHTLTEDLEKDNVEIVILPPNTTSVQPIDQDIISKMKRSYRYKMISRVLTCENDLHEFYKTYSIKDCINVVSEAWEDISPFDIKNAWSKLIPNIGKNSTNKEENDPLEFDLKSIVSYIMGKNFSEDGLQNFLLMCEETEKNYFEEEYSGVNKNNTDENNDEDNNNNQQHIEQQQENLDESNEREDKEIEYLFERLEWYAQSMPYFVQLSLNALKETFLHFL